VFRWRHLSAYAVTAGWRLCDHLPPFVLAADARAKPSLLLYLACVSGLVSAVLRSSLLYVSMWLSVMIQLNIGSLLGYYYGPPVHTRYSKHYRPIDRFQDSGKDLVDQAHGETVKRDLQRRGLAWEEVEAAVLGRQDLRQSVAQCVHTDAG